MDGGLITEKRTAATSAAATRLLATEDASVLAVLLVETARRGALAYAGSESIALIDLILERGLPLEWAGLMVLVGLAVSLASAFFAVRASV